MRFAALLILALAGCGKPKLPSAEESFGEARTLLRSEHFQEAWAKSDLGLQRAGGDSPWRWKLLLLRAEILLAKREAKQAVAALDFQFPPGAQWAEYRGRHLLCRGHAAFLLHNYPEARLRLDEAQAIATSSGASGLLAEIELRLGSLAIGTGDFDDAETKFQYVLEYAAAQGDAYLQMNATGNIGFVLLRSSRFDEAIPWFDKTLVHARSLGAGDSEARIMGNLGSCYYRLGDLDKAIRYFQESESRFAATGNRFERQIRLGNIGNVYRDKLEPGPAEVHYKRALAIASELGDDSWRATWLKNLAEVSIDTGNWDVAERYNNEALELKRKLQDKNAEAYSLVSAAWIAGGRKDLSRAEQIFGSLIRSPVDDPTPSLDAHAGLAHFYAEAGRDQDAEAEYGAVLAAVERQRAELLKDQYKLTYFSSLIKFYQEYVDFLMARGRTRTALEVAESSRARLLIDKMQIKRFRPKQRTAAELQKIAAAYNGTLLSYWLAPGKSYLWVITPAGVSAFTLPAEPEIRRLVENYSALIQNLRDPLSVENPAGRRLYEILIAPARHLLSRAGKVILAADGALYSLNFETLPVFDEKPHYWIEDATVAITPSLGLLSPERAHGGKASQSLLLIGNPISASEQFPALEFAGEEIAAIKTSLPAFRQVVFEKAEAQPDAYAQSDPGRFALIHFVAHAAANREEPLESAVILSRHGANYRLFARDVLNMPLHADLVTISACRSAGARTYAGEGLVGFSWAFLEAGARNVIAGLWDVNDRSTAEIMSHMYAELAKGAAPADALRSAKLRMLHSTNASRKPYYWGPFQLFTGGKG